MCLLPSDVIRYSTLKQEKHTDKKRRKGTVIINQLNCRESARENNIDFLLFFFFTSQWTDMSDKRIEMSKPTESNTLILREKQLCYLQNARMCT